MTESTTSYRVVAPMIQVAVDYKTLKNAALERQFRFGDVMPTWVPRDELDRLLAAGFIEVSA